MKALSVLFAGFAMLMFAASCGKPPASPVPTAGEAKHDDHDHAKTDHKHDGWWCDEHGVPEAECGLCSAKLAADFQKKGDWCKDHDRPDSQCFLCHPELKEQFAAKYVAKYGKQPPMP